MRSLSPPPLAAPPRLVHHRPPPPPGPGPPIGTGSITLDPRDSAKLDIGDTDAGQPPAPPPPGTEDLDLLPGWRPVMSDDGETYYFNDDTGDSSWDAPLRNAPGSRAGSMFAPPISQGSFMAE